MKITKDMKVADIFDSYPQTQSIFQKFGFGALMNPVLRATFGRMTSLETGCRHHGVALDEFLNALNGSLDSEPAANPVPAETQKIQDPEIQNILKMKTNEIVEAYPLTREVFINHFGSGCFSCPSFGQEDVAFACSMHNTDPVVFARDCSRLMRGGRPTQSFVAIHDDETVNDIIGKYPATLEVFHKYGIDSCCGGAHAIKKAADAHKIEIVNLKKELLNAINSAKH